MPINYGTNNVTTSGTISATSGIFLNLLVNNAEVSISGHTHIASNITDFNSAVSGLLPIISNSGNNRILTSDGTSTGINAEPNFSYNSTSKAITFISPETDAQINNGPWLVSSCYRDSQAPGARFIGRRLRGSETSPLPASVNDTMAVFRADTINSSGAYVASCLIKMSADGTTETGYAAAPSRISITTSSGPVSEDNTLELDSTGKLNHNGNMNIEDGLSAPTPIYSLGTLNGNVAINYAVDRQIQTMVLNGSSVNFTKGTGWEPTLGYIRSIDVLLEITVTSTTTVIFDAGLITDWYNQPPAFITGKYLILIRSMGISTRQGHYIGNKTN